MKKRPKLTVEIWQPTNNPAVEERHYYLPATADAREKYVFGLNPKLVSAAAYERILAIIEREINKKSK